MENTLLAYAAGLFDGEGTITLSRVHKNNHRTPVVSVSSTSYELLQFLHTTFGGCISSQKKYKSHHKQSWSWKVSRDKAIDFLNQVLPFMQEEHKRYRALLVVNEYKSVTKRNGKYSKQDKARKLDFENRFFHPSYP